MAQPKKTNPKTIQKPRSAPGKTPPSQARAKPKTKATLAPRPLSRSKPRPKPRQPEAATIQTRPRRQARPKRPDRHVTHRPPRRDPFARSVQVVVTAALWSAWRLPAPAPGAVPPPALTAQASQPLDRSPASADPPKPVQAQGPAGSEIPQKSQQQRQQHSSAGPAAPSLREAFAHAARLAPAERPSWWSRRLAGSAAAREELRTLGDGPPIEDVAPLIPPEFNCTTFVETVIALARSREPGDFFPRLIQVRYRDSHPDYLSRNHFPELDWIPNNARAGVITDVTAEVAQAAGVALSEGSKVLDRGRWLARQKARSREVARALAASAPPGPSWSEPREVRISYIPSAALAQVDARVPDGAVISFVRKNEAKRPVLITHQGIVAHDCSVPPNWTPLRG
jgi:hypothetical protein